jgi:hypothetical protein
MQSPRCIVLASFSLIIPKIVARNWYIGHKTCSIFLYDLRWKHYCLVLGLGCVTHEEIYQTLIL